MHLFYFKYERYLLKYNNIKNWRLNKMILACNNIKKSYGANTVIENISFNIEEKEKAAIVGVNGAGKSTLFKIITGEINFDNGNIIIPKDIEMGYFSQNIEIDSNKTIYEEMLTVFEYIINIENNMRIIEQKMSFSKNEELENLMLQYSSLSHKLEESDGYQYKSRIKGVIKGLGFKDNEFNQPINQLSGGEKTRVALGKLLLKSPKLLLLDEPTNHLDIDSIQWLEDFLRSYTNSVIIISHDRYFLDKIVTKVIEIENKKSSVYFGNYSYYANKKKVDREIELKHYINQQKEIKKQEEAIKKLRSFNREKFIKRAESKEKALNKMELVNKPESLPDKINFELKPKIESGNDVLTVSELEKSFDNEILFKNVSFEIKKGEKAALIGPNGVGKTTLFRIILDKIKSDSGTIKLGTGVTIGYYDQEHQNLDDEKTIFDEISDAFPKLTNTEIRNVLAAFVFTGDDVFKKISSLSGGEKGRVSLAKIMLSNANFLILDEPTNHLDINSKEILENALRKYKGTYLYISHDRYFINNTAQKIFELNKNGMNIYLGNYDYYMEKIQQRKVENKDEDNILETDSENKLDWKKQKEKQSQQRKKENQIKKIEYEIEILEQKINELNEKSTLEEIYTNPFKSKEIFDEKNACDKKLSELYSKWENLI